jgi:hypothetical protein
VQLSSCQLTGNVASQSGGGISLIAGTLTAQAGFYLGELCCPGRLGVVHSSDALQDVVLSGNAAGQVSGTTGLGGGMYMADYCSGGVCVAAVASMLNVTVSGNYAHLVTPPCA